MAFRAAVIVSLLLFSGCSLLFGSSNDEPRVDWRLAPTHVQQIVVNGEPILVGGGCYIIGSCSGHDDGSMTVTSVGAGETLREIGSCPGAPFAVELKEAGSKLIVRWHIGPLPAEYKTLSVPCDGRTELFTRYEAPKPTHELGCAGAWSRVGASGGRFEDIPRPCEIHGAGFVGQAMFRNPSPVSGRVIGEYILLRTIHEGPTRQIAFTAHPFTHNIEPGWENLPKGSSVRLVETIEVK